MSEREIRCHKPCRQLKMTKHEKNLIADLCNELTEFDHGGNDWFHIGPETRAALIKLINQARNQ